MFASLIGRIPYSLTLHGDLSHYGQGQVVKWRSAAFGFVVADHLREQVLARVPGLDEARIAVAPMGVDVEYFRRSTPYPPWTDGPLRLVSSGRLRWEKGHGDVIRAVGLLRSKGMDVKLRILGGGPAHQELIALVEAEGLAAQVELLGAVGENVVKQELEKSHIFLLCSHDEALGVATMEAMAMGLPVVVTRVGGVPHLVRDGVEGLLVPVRDVAAIADAIIAIAANPSLATAMGQAGAARIARHFSARVSAEALVRRLRASAKMASASTGPRSVEQPEHR